MKNGNIEEILAKKTTGEATQAELTLLEGWRLESIDNQSVYDEYSLLWNKAKDYSNVVFEPNFESAFEKHLTLLSDSQSEAAVVKLTPKTVQDIKNNTSTKFFSFNSFQKIAAVLVLGVASYFLFNTSDNNIPASDQIQFVSLEDGSSIWLDKGASLSYDNGFGIEHRDLKLKGKAFFDVQRNEEVPFNVNSSDFKVSVLGTSFTIDEGKFVDVTSGKVKVINENGELLLSKNEKAILKNDQLSQTTTVENGAMWRNPTLTFDNAPLNQVIADINLYYDNRLELNTSSTIECPFTSSNLVDESIENIVAILELSYGLETSQSPEGKSILTIKDCK